MSTIKILITLLAFLLATSLKAQGTAKPFSFPHKSGDMWEYFYYDSPMSIDTLQNFTISDSVGLSGIIHITQYAQFINPNRPATAVLDDTSKYWIDTVHNYVYSNSRGFDSSLVYKLNAEKGEQWPVRSWLPREVARVNDKWTSIIFGRETTFMSISYFAPSYSGDTTGYSVYGGDIIADGFGLVARGGGELSGQISLIGAVIKGKLYGDTTLVSVKQNKNTLPSDLKLFQNYPNPFNQSTTISFEISKRAIISLIIYDMLGKEVISLVDNEDYSIGSYKKIWNGLENNGKKVSSGIYFLVLTIDGLVTAGKKIILMK